MRRHQTPRAHALRTLIALASVPLTLLGSAPARSQPDPQEHPSAMAQPGPDQPRANRLAHEKSPYLLQHAHNPVDWYPWGEEALARARAEDKPIFLSIGYSTCHWCHVMEHESFENEEIAAILNEYFVPIKVDREERPDLDDIYMSAVQAMTGRGGWPMSVWLTPELKPFYGGTYFPPDDRYGRPGFKSLLLRLRRLYTEDRDRIEQAADQLSSSLEQLGTIDDAGGEITFAPVEMAYQSLQRIYDPAQGGWGAAPKFPRSDYGALALRMFRRKGDDAALAMVVRSLDAMADGGMYDHLGGGFARYSTDAQWLVPHFEKMLYDNAQLAFHYLEAYQLTAAPRFARIARETLDYVLRDMTDPRGGFYSAEDADSEGVEGKFYVWTLEEIREHLDDEVFDLFVSHHGVTAEGNWEGHNILVRAMAVEELASRHSLSVHEIEARLARARATLLEIRGRRIRPGLDDKVLTAWKGMMIRALARAAVVLDEPRYLDAATRAADFILESMRDEDGLLRRWRVGEAGIRAYAEDYAFLVSGLLELYQSGFEPRHMAAARELHEQMFSHFGDPDDGALYNTRADAPDLIVRVKTGYDGSVPTANSVAAYNMLALFELTGESGYATQLERLLNAFAGRLQDQPHALITMVLALDAYLGERVELVLADGGDRPGARVLLRAARAGYHPDLFVSLAPRTADSELYRLLPTLAGKGDAERPTAYVCRDFACRLPVTEADQMLEQLDLLRSKP